MDLTQYMSLKFAPVARKYTDFPQEYVIFQTEWTSGSQIFQKPWTHLHILGARKVINFILKIHISEVNL